MMSDLSESFFASSRGNLANYVLPFQMPKPPKKVLKGENAGDTPYVIFASPLMCYLPVHSCVICQSKVLMAKKLHSQSDMAGI